MTINPIDKVKSVKRSEMGTEDVLQKPHTTKRPVPIEGAADFHYQERRLYYLGREVGLVIRELSTSSPQELPGFGAKMQGFRDACFLKKKGFFGFFAQTNSYAYSAEDLSVIYALCDAFSQRLSDLLRRRFLEAQDGMQVIIEDDGQLILNQMNVTAFVQECERQPTEKAKLMVQGLRQRLELLLESRVSSKNYDRLRSATDPILERIDAVLKSQSQ